jgi:tetratricopeptide (TPR) repeat protein
MKNRYRLSVERRFSEMKWEVLLIHYGTALAGFSTYFVAMLLCHAVFDQTGKLRGVLVAFHCFILVLTFVVASVTVSRELQEIAKESISPEEKEALSPKLHISFSPLLEDPSVAAHKYPLYEYSIMVNNQNKNSIPITDLDVKFSFKYQIYSIQMGVIPDTGDSIFHGVRTKEMGDDYSSVTEDEPLDISAPGAPIFTPKKRTVNGTHVNTNEAFLHCDKWSEWAGYAGIVVVNVEKKMMPHIIGRYQGKYYYQIKKERFEERIDGVIPEPNVAMLIAQSHYDKGYDHEKNEQYDEAIVEYSEAIEHNPKLSKAHFRRAFCYSKIRNYPKVIVDNTKAIELSPAYADAYFNRAGAYAELMQYKQAIQDYSEYVTLRPDDSDGYLARARVFALQQEYDREISDYTKALNLHSDRTEEINMRLSMAYNNRGISFPSDSNHSEAIADFTQAIELNPNLYAAHFNWGNRLGIIAKTKDGVEAVALFEAALEKYKKAVEIKPDSHEALNNWGNTLGDLAKIEDGIEGAALLLFACEKYAKAIEIKPDKYKTYDNWASALILLYTKKPGPKDPALLDQAKRKALKAEAIKTGSAAYNLACIAALQGDESQCRKWLETAEAAGTIQTLHHAMTDPDLENIRNKDWFKNIKWIDEK